MTSIFTNSLELSQPLSKDEQTELGRRISAGQEATKSLTENGNLTSEDIDLLLGVVEDGREALEKLFDTNLRLVAHWANVYNRKIPAFAKSTMAIDDLFSEGAIGLRRACEKFDYRKGYAFSTYATYWIRQAIMRSLEAASSIRIPNYLVGEARKAIGDEENWSSYSELVADAVKALSTQSLDRQISEDFTIADTLVDIGASPEESLFAEGTHSNLSVDVEEALQAFSERDQKIVRMRLGIGESPSSYREISEHFGIGANGIRYIVQKRVGDLRVELESRGYGGKTSRVTSP